MTRKRKRIAIGAVMECITLVLALLTFPIWPIEQPVGVWQEREFKANKGEFEKLARNLSHPCWSQFIVDGTGSLAKEDVTDQEVEQALADHPYQLRIRYGYAHGRRSILLGEITKEEIVSIYALRSNIGPNVPGLDYDRTAEVAYLRPDQFVAVQEHGKRLVEQGGGGKGEERR